jgi:type IV pilus assembly protein PilY1
LDLRPSLNDSSGNSVVNNITSYIVGFGETFASGSTLAQAAATAGGGQFITAGSEAELENALLSTSADILSQSGSVASVAFNSSTLNANSAVFLAKFDTTRWSGSLSSFPLSGTGSVGSQAWEASTKIDAQSPTNRVILSSDGTEGVPFRWASQSSGDGVIDTGSGAGQVTDQEDDLNIDHEAGGPDGEGSDRLDYLRGGRSHEGSATNDYRIRTTVLGDVVNSTPVYVGVPELNWPDFSQNSLFGDATHDYSSFKTGSATARSPVLYFGANDGMLHGVDATLGQSSSGAEVIAYVPEAVTSTVYDQGMHYLASKNYNHRFYVDLTPTVSDVFIRRTTAGSRDWRTVLVGGLRAGGKSLFALDVSDPTAFSESNASDLVLWEFSDQDDNDFGLSYSEPLIAMMNNGKWAVIVGNGYNTVDGEGKLFILFIEDGIDGWSSSDYVEIDTEVGTVTDKSGVSSPAAADLDGDGTADRIYAGDLKGNMWVFDVSSTNTSGWKSAYKQGATPMPLFTARDSSSNVQPITSAPVLATNLLVSSGGDPNIIVAFGTGRYLSNGDLSDLDGQSFYGVWDHGDDSLDRGDLEVRTIAASGGLRTVTGNDINWTNTDGWYVDLLDGFTSGSITIAGERVVTRPSIRTDVLFFNTIIPNATPCTAGGSGWLMSVNFNTGLADDLPVFDANNDNNIDNADALYVGELIIDGLPSASGILGTKQYTPTSGGTLDVRDVNVSTGDLEGRLGWEEITPR